MSRFKSILPVLLFAALATGCSTFRPYVPASVNPTCPVSGQRAERSVPAVVWNDYRVGFCSEPCTLTWTAWDEEERAHALGESMSAHPGHSH